MQEKKQLTMWQATAIGLGNIIGAGIFVLAGTVIYDSGPGAVLAFIVTGALAATVALNSAELSSKIVSHGGLYSFTKETLGEQLGFIVGWLRAISYAIATAAVALGFSSYALSAFGVYSVWAELFCAAALIAVATALNYIGVKAVADAEQALVVISIAGLLLFIVASLIYGKFTPERFMPVAPKGIGSIISAASLAFFAYSGFNTVATLTPEVKDGQRNVPRAIVLSLLVSTVLYILVVIGMLALMPWNMYTISADPLAIALAYSRAPDIILYIVDAVAIVATVTVTLSLIVAGSRTVLQMSDDGLLPSFLGRTEKDSPRPGTLAIGALAVVSLFLGNIQYVALASNFGVIFSYALTGISVVIIRKRHVPGKFESPLFPYIQVLSIVLSGVVMYALGFQALYMGVISIIIGMIVHAIYREASSIDARRRQR